MSQHARVESVDALRKFRADLCKFADLVRAALEEAEAEVQRASYWVRQDQQLHWKRQARVRQEDCVRAKSALQRKKLSTSALGVRASCVDEQKALAAAEHRLEEARQKLANVHRWSRLLEEEISQYKGVAAGMSRALEGDIPTGLAQLDRMIASLEAYAAAPTPTHQASTADAPPGEAAATDGRDQGIEGSSDQAQSCDDQSGDREAAESERSREQGTGNREQGTGSREQGTAETEPEARARETRNEE